LSSDFQRALRKLRDERFNVLDNNSPAIDLERLHQSHRTKSGFVGVYANGKGFRAMAKTGPNSPAQRSIGTFQTAEEAAWRRYLYYRQHGLGYGELEIEMEKFRKGVPGEIPPFKGTDDELITEIYQHAQTVGTVEEIFGPGGGNMPERLAKTMNGSRPPTQVPAGFNSNDIPDVFK